MWLLNTTTHRLEEFTGSKDVPKYAVLSHLWDHDGEDGEREISWVEVWQGKQLNTKLAKFCKQAKADGIDYGWVDTCCIPRPSPSQHLARPDVIKMRDEAINSVYECFENAAICYAYLSDVTFDPDSDTGNQRQQQLRNSHWFTSGWTLVELIAPKRVIFYQKHWKRFGTKMDMHGIIANITGIPSELLTRRKSLEDYTVFERMAWARHRMTSGIEDQAYSLMGLFGVKMKLDYTEGEQALVRLREKIQKVHGSSSLDQPAAPLRLLRVAADTLEVEDHPRPGQRVPDYAILSHTWAGTELNFQAVQSGKDLEKHPGYKKVKGACEKAKSHGFEYIWVDTCCIDRTSSAELQEAICSMYRWYRNAKVCYAYLPDYDPKRPESLWACRWFGRGWTLQELIAPNEVQFYDADWTEFDTKASRCEEIALITQIDPRILKGDDPRKRTVAERMSWAASRTTSRLEDVAYCLMGLFEVNMPMLYGEGTQAFIRLQEEIIRRTEDYTIFAWTADPLNNMPRGLFASFPQDFKLSGRSFESISGVSPPNHADASSRYTAGGYVRGQPTALTSRGLHVDLPRMIRSRTDELDPDSYLAWICSVKGTSNNPREELMVCIALQELPNSRPKKFVRLHPRNLFIRPRVDFEEKFRTRTMYALASGKPENSPDLKIPPPLKIGSGSLLFRTDVPGLQWQYIRPGQLAANSESHWDNVRKQLRYSYMSSAKLAIFQCKLGSETFQVLFGFQGNRPYCYIGRNIDINSDALVEFSDRSSTTGLEFQAVIRPTASDGKKQTDSVFMLNVQAIK